MKARGPMFPSEEEIYWEGSETRESIDGQRLEFKHIILTKDSAEQLRDAFGPEWLENYISGALGRLQRWRDRVHETVQ
jgi:hypothetical protein